MNWKGINQIAVRSGNRADLRDGVAAYSAAVIRMLSWSVKCATSKTAEIAIRAALTGHLVFSTLHTNDAPSAFTRLIDMGIEPFLVASSVEAVMAQRLVRTICQHCKTRTKSGT